jgi:hypothetical protein
MPINAMVQGATYVESGWQGDVLSLCSGAPNSQPVRPYPCVDISNPTPGYGSGAGGYGTPTSTFPYFAAPAGLQNYVIQVPVATTDSNATNGSNTITGSVYGQINKGTTGPTGQLIMYFTAYVPYWPVTFDTTQAQFWSDAQQTTYGQNFGTTPIASNQWEWAYCPNGKNGAGYIPNNPKWICLLNGATFDPNRVYEMSFQAKDPLVQGVGFAATRDLISFLRYDTNAPGGGTNPVAGTVNKTMITGQSQSGAFTRTFIFYGFNQDETGRKVFDGAYADRAGRILWMNERFNETNVLPSIFMAGQEGPVWWGDYPNQARGLPPNGLLHRCTASNTCPEVMETWDSNTFYAEKAAADYVGFCSPCASDIPKPANVYRYFVPGTKHGGGAGGFNWAAPGTLPPSSGALYPADPISEQEAFNALNYAFYQLLLNGTPMPPSFGGPGGTYPTLASGQLALATDQTAVRFPKNIPGFPYGGDQAWPTFVYNFGPQVNYDQETGIPTVMPPQIQQALTPYVPTVNSDGNENTGGVAPVALQVPLGTYVGWNIYASYNGCTGQCGYAGQQAQLAGSFWPFWDTMANRLAAGDPRPSLEERYGTHNGFVCMVTKAANKAVQQRFLLPSDAQKLIAQAAASNVLGAPYTPTAKDTTFGNLLCDIPIR